MSCQIMTSDTAGLVTVAETSMSFELALLHPDKSGCSYYRRFDYQGSKEGDSLDDCLYKTIHTDQVIPLS